MLSLALTTVRHQLSRLVGVWVTLVCSTVIIMASALLVVTGSGVFGGSTPVDRLSGVEAVVAAPLSIRPEGGDFSTEVTLTEQTSIDVGLVERLATQPGVERAVGIRELPRVAMTHRGTSQVTVTSWITGTTWPVVTGAAPSGRSVAVTSLTAERLGVAPGQEMSLVGGGTSTRVRVVGIVGTPDSPALVVGTDALLVELGASASTVDAIALDLAPAADREAIESEARRTSAGLRLHTGADIGRLEHREVAAGRGILLAVSGSFGGFAVMISLFVVGILMGLSVDARRRELVVCRALGASPRQVVGMVAGEGLVLGLVAAAVGLWPGTLLADLMAEALRGRGLLPGTLAVSSSPTALLVAGLATVLLVVGVAAGGSAWAATGVALADPAEAMRGSRAPHKAPGGWRRTVGLVMLGTGAVAASTPLFLRTEFGAAGSGSAALLMSFGVGMLAVFVLPPVLRWLLAPTHRVASSWLAQQNLASQPQRLAGVVAPLAMAVGFTMTMVGNQAVLAEAGARQAEQAITAPAIMSAAAPGGLAPAAMAKLEGLPEVEAVVTLRSTTLLKRVAILDGAEFARLPALAVSGPAARALDARVGDGSLGALHGQTVALEESQARVLRLGVGDAADFVLGDGTTVRLTVVATYERGLGLGQALVPDDVVTGHAAPADRALVLARPGGDPTALRTQLGAFAADHPGMALTDADGLAKTSRAESAASAWVNLAGLAVILVFLVIGVVNSLMVVTRTRARELALMRLVGIDRSMIGRVLAWEVLVTSLVAVVGGLLISAIPLGAMAISLLGQPWPVLPLVLPLGLGTGVLVTVAVAVLVPATRALRSDPVQELGARD